MLNSTAESASLGVSSSSIVYSLASYMYYSAVANNLTRLDPAACIKAQATTFQTSRGSLILVTNDSASLPEPFFYDTSLSTITKNGCRPDAYAWICGQGRGDNNCFSHPPPPSCSSQISSLDPNTWKPLGSTVSYCLSEAIGQRCRLEFSPQIAGVVIVFNFIKVLILAYTFFCLNEDPLMTMGDAVASFLGKRDETTKELCLMGKDNVEWWENTHPSREGGSIPEPWPFFAARQKWSKVVSTGRWGICMTLYVYQALNPQQRANDA
jgi:hypothetical protein